MPARGLLVAAWLAATLPAFAQSGTLKIQPGVGVTETYSDNVALSPSDEARSGWITNVSPTLRIDLTGARVKGFLDARFYDLRYAGEPQLDNSQRSVNSRLTVEAIERWLFVDARAETSQQNRSPFLAASDPAAPSANTRNRVQSSVYQVAPVVRGRVGDSAQYAVRYTASELRTDDVLVPESSAGELSARVQSGVAGRRFNWILEASDLSVRNDTVGKQSDSRLRATIVYELLPMLQVSASGGYERTDFTGEQTESQSSPGAGLTWTPSERTQFAAFAERRFFGTGHSLSFNHRTPRTAWRLASVKDASVLPLGISASGTGSIGGLVSYLLTTAIPDPEAREAEVRRKLEEFGISNSSFISSGVVTAQPSVYRNTTAGVTVQGVRHFFTLSLTDREERFRAGSAVGAPQPDDTRQRGIAASLSRRLTPQTSVTLFGGRLKTEGLESGAPDARQGDYGLSFSSRLSDNLTFAGGLRRSRFDSSLPNASYRESSVFVTLAVRT